MGGLWEAALKAGKAILRKAIGRQVLNLEELQTVVAKVEAILNLRPLCKASSEEDQYLTPGHFLVGTTLLELPNMDNYEISLTKRYCLLRQIVQTFWMSWKRSYLNQLQCRNKWKQRQPNLAVGDLLLIKNSQDPVLLWPLAKVVRVFPGPDGLVRSVELETKHKSYLRSNAGVIKLPSQG